MPIFHCIQEVYNIKEWLGESRLHGHSKPLCFEFVLGRDGVVMNYRDQSTDTWQTLEGEDSVVEVRDQILERFSTT